MVNIVRGYDVWMGQLRVRNLLPILGLDFAPTNASFSPISLHNFL